MLLHTHERVFRVRLYESDANGHVYNANYVRYMLEAGLDASAAAGYDLNRYKALNRAWRIQETDIEYLRPITYGDSVRVKTWVAYFQGDASRRRYELYSVNTGELFARASTDWIFIDTNLNIPTNVPPEIIAAFCPDDALTEPAREMFPAAPTPPPGMFKMRTRVSWRDVDPAGYVNNAMYLSYINDCGMEVAARSGWTLDRMWKAGFGILVRRQQIEYLREALMDDEIEIATWLSEVKRSTSIWHFTITRVKNNELLARARTLCVGIDPKTRRLRKMPEEILKNLRDLESDPSVNACP